MIVKILGSSSGISTSGLHHACVYVRTNDSNIIFDAGEGTISQLIKNGYDKDHLDYIAITHFHPDHTCGLYMVLQTLYIQKREKPLTIMLPERIEDFKTTLEMFYTFAERFLMKIDFALISDISNYLPAIRAIKSDHLSSYSDLIEQKALTNTMNSFSVMISEAESRFIYSSDIVSVSHLKEYINETDLIIVDALHCSAEDILLLEANIRKRIILNHGISANIRELYDKRKLLKSELAVEGKEIVL